MRIVTVVLMLALSGCAGDEPTTITGQTMGTTYSIKIVDPVADAGELKALVDAELVRVNDLMSTYIPDSEISRFNRSPIGEPFPVSADMLEVTRMAGEIFRLSGGRFDVTIGPLVNLWGFGAEHSRSVVPPDAEIEAAMARVGYTNLVTGSGTLTRQVDLYLDLSSIAKGYGVDLLAEFLDRRGYSNYLVEIGGELRGRGLSPRDTSWRVAIERPDAAVRVPFKAINIGSMALATSGDYRNYFEVEGERYSHTIDPVTGRPITHNLASVTVLAPSAAWADGMATAINVMGEERGLALAEAQDLAVFVIIKADGGFIEHHSSAFEAYLHD